MSQWLLSCRVENVNLFLWPCLFVPFTIFHARIGDVHFQPSFAQVWLLIDVHLNELSIEN